MSQTVEEYIASLEEDRQEPVRKMREAVLASLPEGYQEGIQYGMIGYFVPHSIYPAGYHCDKKQPLPFAHIASFKGHIGFYPFCIYGNEELKAWFVDELVKAGVKVDAGKACIRFKKFDSIPFHLLGELVAKVPVDTFIEKYEAAIPASKRPKS